MPSNDIADFVYADYAPAHDVDINCFVVGSSNCGGDRCIRNVGSRDGRSWNGGEVDTHISQDLLWEFVILVDKTEASETGIYTEGDEFLNISAILLLTCKHIFYLENQDWLFWK